MFGPQYLPSTSQLRPIPSAEYALHFVYWTAVCVPVRTGWQLRGLPMARPAARKKAAPKGATVTQMLTTPGSGGRRAFVSRATKETHIAAAINLDGTGKYDIKTGIGFL